MGERLMAYLPTAAQAKERSQGNLVIAKEITAIEQAVITAISNSAFTATVSDDTTMTNSTPTDATSEAYYASWKATTTNKVYDEQMSEVRTHFQDQGYTISREANTGATTGSHSSATGDVFKWSISWE